MTEKYRGRPEFIPRDVFRQWLTPHQLSKLFAVDNMLAQSYVARRLREGRPLSSKAGRYRPIDVVAAANMEGLPIRRSRADRAWADIKALEARIAELRTQEEALARALSAKRAHEILGLSALSSRLTDRRILREDEIVAAAEPAARVSCVYFLVHGSRVVYVGQTDDLHARVAAHRGEKVFDACAYIPCDPSVRDFLESLYIHVLQPRLNGDWSKGDMKAAPLNLRSMLDMLSANSGGQGEARD